MNGVPSVAGWAWTAKWWLAAVVITLVGAGAVGFELGRMSADGGQTKGEGADCSVAVGAASAEVTEPEAPREAPELFAPLVFLHPKEHRRPESVDCFLTHAELRWTKEPRPHAGRGEIDAAKLGAGGYQQESASGNCGQSSCMFSTRDFTRPYDQNRKTLSGPEGFFLDVEDAYRGGAKSASGEGPIFTGTPVYYDFVPERFVTYWFFYGFSAPGALAKPGGVSGVGHEGDWERVSVHLDAKNQPLEIAYYTHNNAPLIVPWKDATKLGNHPVVFSAQGSHASYPRADVFRRDFDITRVGFLWPTWDLLEDVRAQPWYGFGGAWGAARGGSKTTGPTGPSAYKHPAPCAWTGDCR